MRGEVPIVNQAILEDTILIFIWVFYCEYIIILNQSRTFPDSLFHVCVTLHFCFSSCSTGKSRWATLKNWAVTFIWFFKGWALSQNSISTFLTLKPSLLETPLSKRLSHTGAEQDPTLPGSLFDLPDHKQLAICGISHLSPLQSYWE